MTSSAPHLVGAAGSRSFSTALAAAGAHRIVAYHSSAYRELGLPSVAGLLPWANANEQTLTMLPGVIAGAGDVPVLATVCANDGLLPTAVMLDRLAATGAAGVLNAPTVGLLSGSVREVLEAEGLGRSSEMRLLSDATAKGLEAWAYVFDEEWVELAVDVGATAVIVHLGITGYPTHERYADAQQLGTACIRAARRVNDTVPVLLHGGDLRTPRDLCDYLAILDGEDAAHVSGFFGASAFERYPDTSATLAAWAAAASCEPATQTSATERSFQ